MVDKFGKKAREDSWFDANEKEVIRLAKEKKRKEEEKKRASQKAEELATLKKLHWMKCPKCGHDMKEIEYSGIQIDECTLCGGVYFDLGELDSLLQSEISQCKGFFKKLFSS